MIHIDYFFSTLSSYSYLAGNRLEEIAARQEYRVQELLRQAKKSGLHINLQPAHTQTNDRPSACAIIAAQRAGGGDLGALAHAILRAAWGEDKDIAQLAVIKECLALSGFDPSLAGEDMADCEQEYETNFTEAMTRGVFGAPFYIVCETDERFWEQDRLDDLDAYLAGVG